MTIVPGKVFDDYHAALFQISVSRSRNLLHRCFGRVNYEPYAIATHNVRARLKNFSSKNIYLL